MNDFIPPARIEARAAELWRQFGLEPGFDIEALLDDLDLSLTWEMIDDTAGTGDMLGQLVPAQKLIVMNERHLERLEARGRAQLRFTVGHEIGHWIFHAPGGFGSSALFDGVRTLCRDGSTAPIERQAESFSAALLLHRDSLQSALPEGSWSGWGPVYGLAEKFAVSATAMQIRLQGLGWAHRDEGGRPHSGPEPTPGQESLFA
jgi:Zn-dependent peptidase ImmA (M78 family)